MKYSSFIYPFLSGLCGSLAGSCGKITFQEENYFEFEQQYMNYGVRVFGFILVLLFNQFMMKFLLNSFQLNGATLTVLLSFIFNSISNFAVGYFAYNERLTTRWGVGMLFIMIGVLLISNKNKQQSQNNEIDESSQETQNKKDKQNKKISKSTSNDKKNKNDKKND